MVVEAGRPCVNTCLNYILNVLTVNASLIFPVVFQRKEVTSIARSLNIVNTSAKK